LYRKLTILDATLQIGRTRTRKSFAAQKRLSDRDRCLSAFRYGHSDKKDVARYVTRDINARNAPFLRCRINHMPLTIDVFRLDDLLDPVGRAWLS